MIDKIERVDAFLDNLNSKLDGSLEKFDDHEWYQGHIQLHKHHALIYTGEEPIMLADIIHMLVDWVAAGRGRAVDGEFEVRDYHKGPEFQEKIGPLLLEAFDNTLAWLVENTERGEFNNQTQTEEVDVVDPIQPEEGDIEEVDDLEEIEDE
jgi:hypothetical protein